MCKLFRQNVADKFNIPRYVICASPAKVLAALLYTPELAAQGILPVDPSQASQLVDIPGLSPIRKADFSPFVQTQFGLQFFELYVYRCCQPAVEAAAGYFFNSFEELEPTCIEALRSYPYRQRAHSKVTRQPVKFSNPLYSNLTILVSDNRGFNQLGGSNSIPLLFC